MFESGKPPVVENTEENRQICRKYCTICQNYKRHSLEKHQPTEPLLRLRDVQCPEYERDRLLLPGLSAFHEVTTSVADISA